MGHRVALVDDWQGTPRLVKFAEMAITDCLADIPREEWATLPLILCVAESTRPGRFDDLEAPLLGEIMGALDTKFATQSTVLPRGRMGVCVALAQARRLISDGVYPRVLIAAVDSIWNGQTLEHLENNGRLLTRRNSNGFMPGEGGGAILVGSESDSTSLICAGIGFAVETSSIDSEEPLRADGLTQAHRNALLEANCQMHDINFRIADLSGEQYYFKEADLALSRLLRIRQEDPELWHPAECVGECGAVSGAICISVAKAAIDKKYSPGRRILLHFGDDAGDRASLIVMQR